MSRSKDAIRFQFNRSAAGSYDIHAHVQRRMANQLTNSLIGWKNKGISERLDILEIGCGTGVLTEMLYNQWPSAAITALDIAPEMIKVAEQRVLSESKSSRQNNDTDSNTSGSQTQPSRLSFIQDDIELWSAHALPNSLDLIVSNACFQWLNNPLQTLIQLKRILRMGGLLVFTTFGPDTFCELHKAFNEVYRVNGMKPQRHGLSFQSSEQWNSLLNEAGFTMVHHGKSIQMERYSSARDFLLSVKAMGASRSEATVMPGLSTRRLFADMYKEYEAKFSIEEGIAATYDLQLFQANFIL